MRAVAVLAAGVPFAFAIIRLIQTRSDIRPLAMAIAALAGVAAILAIPSLRDRAPFVRFALTLVLSTLLAAGTGFAVGARSGAVLAVAGAFGLFDGLYVSLRGRS
jgi:hypothetical protein